MAYESDLAPAVRTECVHFIVRQDDSTKIASCMCARYKQRTLNYTARKVLDWRASAGSSNWTVDGRNNLHLVPYAPKGEKERQVGEGANDDLEARKEGSLIPRPREAPPWQCNPFFSHEGKHLCMRLTA